MYRLFTVFALLCVLSNSVSAWWNEEWTYRKVINIDTTDSGLQLTEPAGEMTVLIRLHQGNFEYFFDVKEGGADLRFFAADDSTPLTHHVEKLDPLNSMALIWVKVPQIAAGLTDKIYMYYGNQAAVSSNDVAGSFDQAEVMAIHFDDTSSPQDKTYNGNHPSSTAEIIKASLIGQGAKFNGSTALTFSNSSTLNLISEPGFTISSWIKPEAASEGAVIYEYSDGTSSVSLIQQGNALIAKTSGAIGDVESSPSQPLLLNDWQHVALVFQGTQMSLFVNGISSSVTTIQPLNLTGQLSVGNSVVVDEATPTGFVGEMDELRVASVARTTGWLKATADNQGKLARMIAYGGDESKDSEGSAEGDHGGGGYFGIIISNVFDNEHAIVEQIVIGFCGFMAVVAFLIMFYKTYQIMVARGASKKFLKAYESLGADKKNFAKLYNADKKYGKSPLFVVYKQGINQLRKRMSPAVGAEFSGLEPKSLSAIRSSLDATMVREGQKINSLIVLLTIAISGGPFIGLLGTVVGVMVTFAGIAASGEVNINAIAPGMAAALLATTAGLGVAIPALFGYNYIGSQIKELSADMHVFAEEFMGRMTESFGR